MPHSVITSSISVGATVTDSSAAAAGDARLSLVVGGADQADDGLEHEHGAAVDQVVQAPRAHRNAGHDLGRVRRLATPGEDGRAR
jgi:hypothetical protein